MALEASHIRFALDIKDTLGVKNIQKYIPGVLYPDSRYITKVDRNLTHPQSLLDNGYSDLDDFKKGCYAHLAYDKILEGYTIETLPDLFNSIGAFTGQGSEYWIRLTALKILQDIEDVHAFDIKSYLPMLDYIENPNNENIDLIRKYNQFFQKFYASPETYSVENCYAMWGFLGITGEVEVKLKAKTEEYKNDPRIKDFIKIVYPQTLMCWNRQQALL